MGTELRPLLLQSLMSGPKQIDLANAIGKLSAVRAMYADSPEHNGPKPYHEKFELAALLLQESNSKPFNTRTVVLS